MVRELTKLHEEVWRGTLEEAASRWADGTKGEVTLVVEGADEPVPDLDAALEEVGRLVADGLSRSEAVRLVAAAHAVPRRRLYEMCNPPGCPKYRRSDQEVLAAARAPLVRCDEAGSRSSARGSGSSSTCGGASSNRSAAALHASAGPSNRDAISSSTAR